MGRKWVLKTIRNALRQIVKYKIRWVVQRFYHLYGIDIDQTYILVILSNSYKVFLVFAIKIKLRVDYMDFVIAFLTSAIGGYDIFMEQPLVYKDEINLVYKQLKVCYILK